MTGDNQKWREAEAAPREGRSGRSMRQLPEEERSKYLTIRRPVGGGLESKEVAHRPQH